MPALRQQDAGGEFVRYPREPPWHDNTHFSGAIRRKTLADRRMTHENRPQTPVVTPPPLRRVRFVPPKSRCGTTPLIIVRGLRVSSLLHHSGVQSKRTKP